MSRFFIITYRLREHENSVSVIIIENKDTFYSIKDLMKDDIRIWNGIELSLVIYGEGRKIKKSFNFFYDLEKTKGEKANICYFGDLDPEGISMAGFKCKV